MALESKNKIDPAFSLSSMTDIIFLLLIFFMLTSSAITPTGLPINQPSSKGSTIQMQKVKVTITKDLKYYLDDQLVALQNLELKLRQSLEAAEPGKGAVIIYVDKDVATEHFIKVAGIAASLKAKVTVATKPE